MVNERFKLGPACQWQQGIVLGRHRQLGRMDNPLWQRLIAVINTRFRGRRKTQYVAAERIVIGDRVQVGANSTIVDTDFHPLTAAERARDFLAGAHAPIIIEDDVFIGMNSLILKGLVLSRVEVVTIGRGSVVGAGSVVTRNVPPGVPSPIYCGRQPGDRGEAAGEQSITTPDISWLHVYVVVYGIMRR